MSMGVNQPVLNCGQEEALDVGPIFDVFCEGTRGRVRCDGSKISRITMLASEFAR